ncbi:hypothetical protein BDQ17DRAFT_1367415 [Cyathus striatus]|nr:hypothetical protein BDQ17DRAFT_1367415 [Cyathus striatus]
MSYPISPADLSTSGIDSISFLHSLNTAFLAETLLYGVHVVLFFICIFILVSHRRTTQPFLLVAIVTMFMLSTADIAVSFRVILRDVPLVFNQALDTVFSHTYPKGPIFVANNFIADLLLLYRCYVVWNRRKIAVLLSSLLLIADTVWGWVGEGTPIFSLTARFAPVFYWTVFATNVLMTAATAGRIYWLSRAVSPMLKYGGGIRRYQVATTILVESAIIYSACLLALVISFHNMERRFFWGCIVMRIVAIMPTLMVVQVGLSQSKRKESILPLSSESKDSDTISGSDVTIHHMSQFSTIRNASTIQVPPTTIQRIHHSTSLNPT